MKKLKIWHNLIIFQVFHAKSALHQNCIPCSYVYAFCSTDRLITGNNFIIFELQFVLLMDPLSMRVEWRCITMVNGVQCVMMDGI